MSQADTPGLGLEMMTLRGPELARLLESLGLSPAPGSPLANRPLDPRDANPEMAAALSRDVREAALRVARPERVVAMATGMPPDPPEHLWFYGKAADMDFALYAEGPDDRHHLAWPVDGVSMLDLAAAPLSLSRGTEPTALSLALGPEEFCTLCAISDFLRQETLRTLLAPAPRPDGLPVFGPEDLARAAARAGSFSDLSWTVPRAQVLSPVPLDFGVEALEAGQASLRESGFLIPVGERSEPSALLHSLGLQLGTCQGFTALSNWRSDGASGSWALEHFALSRGPGSLLLLEFQDVSESGFLVALDDLTPELAFHWLTGGLPIPESGAWTREPELPEAEFEPAGGKLRTHFPRFCTGCGKPLEPCRRFCTGCGAPVKEVGAHD